MELLHTVVMFLVVLLVLVSIHEWGHFYIARRCGVKVQRFSVGFGKPFWRIYDKHGTEFAIAPIPLGGYVKMLDETDANIPEQDKNKTFESRKTWQQIAILFAGPAANYILAAILFWVLALQPATMPSPVIGSVEPSSPAAFAGVERGQQIVAVDGHAVVSHADVYEQLMHRLGETGSIMLTVQYPDNGALRYDMELVVDDWMKGVEAPNPMKGLGLTFFRPTIPAVVGEVTKGSPAMKGGLETGDEIVAVDDIEVKDWEQWSQYVRERPNQVVQFKVRRGEAFLTLDITPELIEDGGQTFGRVGVLNAPVSWPEEMLIQRELGPIAAVYQALADTWSNSVMVFISIKKLLLGEISVKNLSGPIGIAKVAGDSARAGLQYYIHFMAVLSVYLGVFNLLPIPILDGGRIVFCLAEGIKGRPVSDRTKMVSMQLGLMFLGVLMVMAFYYDIMRLQ